MGVISVEQTDELYWLGRYLERVYTTMRLYFVTYDSMLDQPGEKYAEFCRQLDIPNIYHSREDFCQRYSFDETDCNSMISNLKRAYDNAIVLREEIGSESLSYIQLSIYEMQKAAKSDAPLIEFQKVLDNLMAFWGVSDDIILSENIRNILKVGKRVERIDMYGRLRRSRKDLNREICRLAGRIDRCNLKYRKDVIEHLQSLIQEENINYPAIVTEIEQILEVSP
ncbi:MAG: alpha-E domain-containing protein [Blautia sp.]|nr:alpha-E domain-containing protein [Blautia sp.]MDY5031257.1 alpha-E domain-containing protein [Blautia sp.]